MAPSHPFPWCQSPLQSPPLAPLDPPPPRRRRISDVPRPFAKFDHRRFRSACRQARSNREEVEFANLQGWRREGSRAARGPRLGGDSETARRYGCGSVRCACGGGGGTAGLAAATPLHPGIRSARVFARREREARTRPRRGGRGLIGHSEHKADRDRERRGGETGHIGHINNCDQNVCPSRASLSKSPPARISAT